jgi:glycosyltransferase involved in cell wall biosynthesis
MASAGISRNGTRVRLAYLCNLYPAVSHSFVRREIEGVEQAGHEVHRFSLRPARADLKDESDLREAACTQVVLRQGALRLIFSALLLAFSRPGKTFHAIGAAASLSGPGIGSKFRHLAYWLEAAWLVRRLEALRIEHVHAHFGTNPAAVALIARAWGGPPFSFTVHGPDEFDAPVALSLGRKIAGAAFVVAITHYCRSQLMRWSAPTEWEKIKVIRCGLDDEILNATPEPVSAASTDFVCIARLSTQKGLPLLIAACERLRDAGEQFALTIIGGGELRESLDQEIERRRLAGVVTLAGICPTPDMHRRLRGARAFVLPSFAEGLPMTIMEAFALSRPVVTTMIAGIPELVDDECGWLIPAGSVEALAEAMKSALHAPAAELSRKGAVGRERVLRQHSVRITAAEIVHAIEARPGATS